MRVVLLAALLGTVGCGDATADGAAVAAAGGGGSAASVGSGPSDAGLPPLACKPGEVEQSDHSCKPAGIAPNECAPGFAADGAAGCTPILPAGPCASGTMAIPGDSACHPPVPCAAGPWGDIPVAADTQYVDASYAGASDGSAQKPWPAIQKAVDAAKPGAIVAIAKGSYAGAVLGRPVVLWGKCPAEVTLFGGAQDNTIEIGAGADGSAIRGVAITQGKRAIRMAGVKQVVVDGVWIHDTGAYGIAVVNAGAVTGQAKLSRVLVERVRQLGVVGYGAALEVRDSVIRDVAQEGGAYGRGIEGNSQELPGTSLTVSRCVIERAFEAGIQLFGVPATVEQTVIRELKGPAACIHGAALGKTMPSLGVTGSLVAKCGGDGVASEGGTVTMSRSVARDLSGGAAIAVDQPAGPTTVAVDFSLVDGVAGQGVYFTSGTSLSLEGVIIRHVTDPPGGPQGGVAVGAATLDGPSALTKLSVRGSVLEAIASAGISLAGVDASITATRIRGLHGGDPLLGAVGIAVDPRHGSGAASIVTVSGSEIDDVTGFALEIGSSDVTVDSTWIHGISGRAGQGSGVLVLQRKDSPAPGVARFRRGKIEGNGILAAWALNAELHLEHSVVDVAPSGASLLGDGAIAQSFHSLPQRARLIVDESAILRAPRAGVSDFGGDVELHDTRVACSGLALDGEEQPKDGGGTSPYAFQDLGGNVCGCDHDEPCHVVSSKLTPPEPP